MRYFEKFDCYNPPKKAINLRGKLSAYYPDVIIDYNMGFQDAYLSAGHRRKDPKKAATSTNYMFGYNDGKLARCKYKHVKGDIIFIYKGQEVTNG